MKMIPSPVADSVTTKRVMPGLFSTLEPTKRHVPTRGARTRTETASEAQTQLAEPAATRSRGGRLRARITTPPATVTTPAAMSTDTPGTPAIR